MNGKIRLSHFFAPLSFGGGETFIINFLRGSGDIFENRVILFSESSEFSQELGKIASVTSVRLFDVDMGRGTKRAYITLLVRAMSHPFKIEKAVKGEEGGDIVIGHGFPFNFVLPFLKATGGLKGKKIVYFQHHRLMSSSGSALQRAIYRRLFRSFDAIIANTPVVKDDIIAVDKGLEDKIIVYGVGLDFEYIKERATKAIPAVSALGIPADRVLAIYPARFMPHKNHRIFLKIFEALKKKNLLKKIFVVFSAGDGPVKKELQDALAATGFEGECLLPEHLDHDALLGVMALSGICIFPSLEEGFGLGVLEALVLDVPVVSFRDALPKELGAFTLAAGDENEFVVMVCRLVEDAGFRHDAKERLKEQRTALANMSDLRQTSRFLRDSFARVIAGTGI